jgi:hypothetical protein
VLIIMLAGMSISTRPASYDFSALRSETPSPFCRRGQTNNRSFSFCQIPWPSKQVLLPINIPIAKMPSQAPRSSNQYPYQPSQNISPRTSYIPSHASTSNPNPAPPFPAKPPSRVHFYEPEAPGNGMKPPVLPFASAQPILRPDGNQFGPPEWNIPNYNGNDARNRRRSASANANDGQ